MTPGNCILMEKILPGLNLFFTDHHDALGGNIHQVPYIISAIIVKNSQIIDQMNSFELSLVAVLHARSNALVESILIHLLPLTIKRLIIYQ